MKNTAGFFLSCIWNYILLLVSQNWRLCYGIYSTCYWLLWYSSADHSSSINRFAGNDRAVLCRVLLERLVQRLDLLEQPPVPCHAVLAQHRHRHLDGGRRGRFRGSVIHRNIHQIGCYHHIYSADHYTLSYFAAFLYRGPDSRICEGLTKAARSGCDTIKPYKTTYSAQQPKGNDHEF